MLPDFHALFHKYNEQLKPLISEIEGRLEYFSEPLLQNLASVFDYLSIAAAPGQDEKANIAKAEEYIDRCLAQSYMYLIYSIKQSTDKFEKNLGKRGLRKLDRGRFVGKYMNLKKERRRLLEAAGTKNEIDALPLLKEAHDKATEMESMVNMEEPSVSVALSESTSWWIVLLKWILSICISVVVAYLVNCYICK